MTKALLHATYEHFKGTLQRSHLCRTSAKQTSLRPACVMLLTKRMCPKLIKILTWYLLLTV